MKPMTTMHLRFIAKKPPKAESRECLYDCRGITRDDAIRRHAFRHHRARSNAGIFAAGDTLEDDCIHPDPHLIGNLHRSRFQLRTRWAIFVKWSNCLHIYESLGHPDRMTSV